MCEPAGGEFIAKSASRLSVRDEAGAETLRGLLCPVPVLRMGGRRRLSKDRMILWGAGGSAVTCQSTKRVRGGGRKLPPRSLPEHPGRAKPMGGSSARRAKPPNGRQGLSGGLKTQKPEPVGPAYRFGGGNNDGWNGMWVHLGGNAPDTFREEKPPKGESHERCRCETEPARDRRE
jgi:hypothetical protein